MDRRNRYRMPKPLGGSSLVSKMAHAIEASDPDFLNRLGQPDRHGEQRILYEVIVGSDPMDQDKERVIWWSMDNLYFYLTIGNRKKGSADPISSARKITICKNEVVPLIALFEKLPSVM